MILSRAVKFFKNKNAAPMPNQSFADDDDQ